MPIAGSLIGGVIGGAAYQWLIRPYLPARTRALEEERMRLARGAQAAE